MNKIVRAVLNRFVKHGAVYEEIVVPVFYMLNGIPENRLPVFLPGQFEFGADKVYI